MKPTDAVSQLLDENDDSARADEIYQKALAEHEEWWSGYYQGEVNVDDYADRLLDKILATYAVEPGSNLADLIYEHVYAGLT